MCILLRYLFSLLKKLQFLNGLLSTENFHHYFSTFAVLSFNFLQSLPWNAIKNGAIYNQLLLILQQLNGGINSSFAFCWKAHQRLPKVFYYGPGHRQNSSKRQGSPPLFGSSSRQSDNVVHIFNKPSERTSNQNIEGPSRFNPRL